MEQWSIAIFYLYVSTLPPGILLVKLICAYLLYISVLYGCVCAFHPFFHGLSSYFFLKQLQNLNKLANRS